VGKIVTPRFWNIVCLTFRPLYLTLNAAGLRVTWPLGLNPSESPGIITLNENNCFTFTITFSGKKCYNELYWAIWFYRKQIVKWFYTSIPGHPSWFIVIWLDLDDIDSHQIHAHSSLFYKYNTVWISIFFLPIMSRTVHHQKHNNLVGRNQGYLTVTICSLLYRKSKTKHLFLLA
jgi:hypothetical protein